MSMRRLARRLFTLCSCLTSSACLFSSGCVACWGPPTTARVFVVERDGRPVVGASVRPYFDSCYAGALTSGREVHTDAEGRATIRERTTGFFRGFTVIADGYTQYVPRWTPTGGNYPGEAGPDGTRTLLMLPDDSGPSDSTDVGTGP